MASSIHINGKVGDFAEICLLPGDPLRAKFIADTYLTDVKQVNSVRNNLAYTGTYKGKKVSVFGTGMGIPSISIFAHELITVFGVKKLIRIGTCGAVSKEVKVRDIVIGMGACTDSKVNRFRFNDCDFAAISDYGLLTNLVDSCKNHKITPKVGNVFSTDLFYHPDNDKFFQIMEKLNIYGIEMEAAGLYGVAAENGAKASCICTVSDQIITGDKLNSEEREQTLHQMMEIALDACVLSYDDEKKQ